MKPAAFAYFDPTSLDEALALLVEHGAEAKLIAGGQSLVPLMNLRLARPAALVDLGRVPGLRYIRQEGDELRIGAMTTHAEIEESTLLAAGCPILPAAARLIGHLQIRSRGTIGGSVAHADPAAEWPLVLAALDARFVLRGPGGERVVAPRDFFLTYLTADLAPDEILTEIQVPLPPADHGWSMQEVARRHGDYALVAAAAIVTRTDGQVGGVSLTLGGVGGVPVETGAVGDLVGQRADMVDLAAVARALTADLEPDDDIHAPAEYRREVAEVLAARALHEALARAGIAPSPPGRALG